MILEDLEAARQSREKNRRATNDFYDRQAQILKGWEAGGCYLPVPKELRFGSLPEGEIIRGLRRK